MHRCRSSIDLRQLPAVWRSAPPRWGNSLHSLCSYMAMFPPTLPRVFIHWLTQPGDVVYDPFSGRGTTVLEACLLGRIGFGSDANPLAWLLTAAKADPPTTVDVIRRLRELEVTRKIVDPSQAPASIRMLFHPKTLGQLMWLRRELSERSRVDRFLMAVLLGGLHHNVKKNGLPGGLTVAMPNTFAMAPGYVARYIRKHRLRAPQIDVVDFVANRITRFPVPGSGFERGRAWRQDVREQIRWPENSSGAKLILTSPPYLSVIRYGQYNWIRHWVIGSEPHQVDSCLFTSGSLGKYVDFMREAIGHLRSVLRHDGFICLVIGDVQRDNGVEIRLAEAVGENCIDGLDLRIVDIIEDRLPVERKVSRIWGKTKGRATKIDRILVLAAPSARLPRKLPMLSWS